MQVLWRKLNLGMWFWGVLGRKNTRFVSRSSLGGTQREAPEWMPLLIYIRMRVPAWLFGSGASPVTKLCRACGDMIYISTERSPEQP